MACVKCLILDSHVWPHIHQLYIVNVSRTGLKLHEALSYNKDEAPIAIKNITEVIIHKR